MNVLAALALVGTLNGREPRPLKPRFMLSFWNAHIGVREFLGCFNTVVPFDVCSLVEVNVRFVDLSITHLPPVRLFCSTSDTEHIASSWA